MRLIQLDDRTEIERLHQESLAPRVKAKLKDVWVDRSLIKLFYRHPKLRSYVSKLKGYSVEDFLVMSVKDMRSLVKSVDTDMPAVDFSKTNRSVGHEEKAFKLLNSRLRMCFDYEWFSRKAKWNLGMLAEKLNKHLKFCPYCNAETVYAFTIKEGKARVLKSAFDHYFPRARYPFLGLSLYNLIPACTRCNSSLKRNQYTDLVSMAHPYGEGQSDPMSDEDMHRNMKFNLIFNDAKCLSYCGAENIDSIILSERVRGAFDRGLKWEKLFLISDCYTKIYRNDAAVAYRRATAYPQSYVCAKVEELKRAGLPVAGLEEFLYGASLDEEEINSHRFGKLIWDIVETYRK